VPEVSQKNASGFSLQMGGEGAGPGEENRLKRGTPAFGKLRKNTKKKEKRRDKGSTLVFSRDAIGSSGALIRELIRKQLRLFHQRLG